MDFATFAVITHGLVEVVKYQFPEVTGGTLTNVWALAFGVGAVAATGDALYVLEADVAGWFNAAVTAVGLAFGGGFIDKTFGSIASFGSNS